MKGTLTRTRKNIIPKNPVFCVPQTIEMKKAVFAFLVLSFAILPHPGVYAQERGYSIANTHSHNDYKQAIPFWLAYSHGFGSIEADIFLVDGGLLVAHSRKELDPRLTLERLYLQPILECLKKNKGSVYADPSRGLQLLIDIKTDSIHTLDKLVETIRKYPELVACPTLHFVITGNRPDAS